MAICQPGLRTPGHGRLITVDNRRTEPALRRFLLREHAGQVARLWIPERMLLPERILCVKGAPPGGKPTVQVIPQVYTDADYSEAHLYIGVIAAAATLALAIILRTGRTPGPWRCRRSGAGTGERHHRAVRG